MAIKKSGLKWDLMQAKVKAAQDVGIKPPDIKRDSYLEREAHYTSRAIIKALREANFTITQLKAPASRVRITKLAPGKTIPFHVDYDVSYAVRCICPVYGGSNVINLFKRDGKLEAYNLEDGTANFLNIGYPHAVVNMSDQPRIALMFSLDGTDDLATL